MARTDDRGGGRTRARLAEVATRLFLERGFDAVTVAGVAQAAGVSTATVFSHFARKEDLLLDRLPDAAALIAQALQNRPTGRSAAAAIGALAVRLLDQRHPLSGMSDGALPFLQTISASTALTGRARELLADLEIALAIEMRQDSSFDGDPELMAALIIAAYRTVFTDGVRRRLAGEDISTLIAPQRLRLEAAFIAVERAEHTESNSRAR